jgi:hypothetical protein
VPFLVTNGGSIDHEMVIVTLSNSQAVGIRPIGGDAKIDEAGSLGQASNTDGKGAGQGVVPGAPSWMTITLAPGNMNWSATLTGHHTAVYPAHGHRVLIAPPARFALTGYALRFRDAQHRSPCALFFAAVVVVSWSRC